MPNYLIHLFLIFYTAIRKNIYRHKEQLFELKEIYEIERIDRKLIKRNRDFKSLFFLRNLQDETYRFVKEI